MLADRQLGIAVDFSPSSTHALQWAVDNLFRNGDEVTILTVVQQRTSDTQGWEPMWDATGSPLIPFDDFTKISVMSTYGVDVSPGVCASLDRLTWSKQVTVSGKVYYGDAREKLLDAVVELPLDTLVIGSRRLGGLQKMFMGSVSDYVVNNSPCPVTVVKLPQAF